MIDELEDKPHRRFNILTGEWVLVSGHRAKRPWQGQQEATSPETKPNYDQDCYLCPGNTRVSGEANPVYDSVYVFDNDHAALTQLNETLARNTDGLLQARSESGRCKVICFSPKHDLTLAQMEVADIYSVIEVWAEEYQSLGAQEDINHVQIFENKGAVMGCSNPHPHGQIWAQESVPNEMIKELERMQRYYNANHNTPLLQAYLELELKEQERIVCENEHFLVVVPYWAIWPFETLVLPKELPNAQPKQTVTNISQMSKAQKYNFADIIKEITSIYDALFNTSFPYSAGIHQAPTDGKDYPECTLHMHFYPPLLRSATVKKFMVGYEMLGGPQRDITPEKSALLLREAANSR